ncbi:uncharacterized protein KY384_001382 [Bacidia gigantensis]|uniref:uncharacterized protein n=1 Tax=Bacidia gigantensis TaxID=2732470 RepID=UPI001D05AE10|nr:uncharacterized protein KY384_001382 [Bacidia gigantensis]KAG8533641.1 hypothetical protein KY384_001382 [Bacidia gigantensis]
MARDQAEPLLRDSRPSSEQSSERHLEEEDAYISGKEAPPRKRGREAWREIGLFAWAVIATALVIILGVLYQHGQTTQPAPSDDGGKDSAKPKGKRNMIFMVSDGMGPTSLSMTRSFLQTSSDFPFDHELVLDSHLIGSSRTRSTDSLITDSAAGATAFSCGKKSYNSAISVLPDHSACGTVLEAAKEAGYMTGLVVTTRITDATPACFAAHVNRRESEDEIAEQEIGHSHPMGRVVDLILGGGRCHFMSNSTQDSCRQDNTDVIQIAKDSGWEYIFNRNDFDNLDKGSAVKLPLLGLFASTDIPYEIDRKLQTDKYPSLSEMASVALTALSKATQNSDKGFFLMIEGSRIDHAGHANDPLAQVHEVLEYDKAFSTALDFLDKDATEGVIVSTSDHETGGLAAARQLSEDKYPQYAWYPDMLVNGTHSASFLAHELKGHMGSPMGSSESAMKTFIRSQIVEAGLGVKDVTDGEIDEIWDSVHPDPKQQTGYLLADMISRRAQIGWSSHGHSAVDVNIYASSPDAAKPLIGNHENTEIGEFMASYLDLDLGKITEELQAKAPKEESWKGALVSDEDSNEGLDHYHGEFKKRRKRAIGKT